MPIGVKAASVHRMGAGLMDCQNLTVSEAGSLKAANMVLRQLGW